MHSPFYVNQDKGDAHRLHVLLGKNTSVLEKGPIVGKVSDCFYDAFEAKGLNHCFQNLHDREWSGNGVESSHMSVTESVLFSHFFLW